MNISTMISNQNWLGLGMYIGKPILILIICALIIRLVLNVVEGLFKKSNLEKGIQTFTMSALKIALWAIALITVAGALGIETASLVTIVGVASLALSLSVQNILTNVFSGITILLSKPFKVGDFIEVSGISGTVKAIDLMRTTLDTPDNKVELIPNSDIASSKISNYSTEELRRVDLHFTASYDNTTEDVEEALTEAVSLTTGVLDTPKTFVAINAYNANDIDYVVRVWCKNSDYWDVYFGLNKKVREVYDQKGIQFSYPHTIVHMVKEQDETSKKTDKNSK